MATARKLELNALLNPIQKAVSGLTSGNTKIANSFSLTPTSGYGEMLYSFAMALFIIFLILIVIHYTITPIFSLTPGDGGLVPLPTTKDGQLVWTDAPPPSDLSANVIRILPHGFTIQQDVYMDNESDLSNRKRIFFYRSTSPITVDPTQPEDLLTQYPESNLFMYLSPNTNDLIVTAITKKPNNDLVFESAPTLLNVPIKQVIRLTVVFLPQLIEVYLNGKLHGSRTFIYPPLSSASYFYSSPTAFRGTVRAMNFKYWDRPLSAVEVKNSSPPLAEKSLFSPDEMSTGKCN